MSMIDLADVKVSYEGQTLPVTTLITKLQAQLQEATCRIAAISSTLGDLQAALLNTATVEVKLTLTREDYGRFRALEGADDHERIRRAVMVMIRGGEGEPSSAGAASESRPEAEALPRERILEEQPAAQTARIKATTQCPRCQSLIELPDTSNDQWSVEIRCGSCGTKYLVKTKADALVNNQMGT